MLDSSHVAEMFAHAKLDDLDRVIQRHQLLAPLDQPARRRRRARQAIAGALMRIAVIIDDSADTRVAATAP
jgi:hypothetical protein